MKTEEQIIGAVLYYAEEFRRSEDPRYKAMAVDCARVLLWAVDAVDQDPLIRLFSDAFEYSALEANLLAQEACYLMFDKSVIAPRRDQASASE